MFGPTGATYKPLPMLLTPLPEILTDNPDWQCGRGTLDWMVRFFHLTGSTAHQVVTFHPLFAFTPLYFNLCLSTLAGGCFNMFTTRSSRAATTSDRGGVQHNLCQSDKLDCVSTAKSLQSYNVSIQYMVYWEMSLHSPGIFVLEKGLDLCSASSQDLKPTLGQVYRVIQKEWEK